jgi:hypothetical protein
MQAIREIKRVDKNQLTIAVPDAFLEKEVEIIVLPIDEGKKPVKTDREASFLKFTDQFCFKLPVDY